MELLVDSVADGWNAILEAWSGDVPKRIATRHGISFDLAGLTIIVENPYDRRLPDSYDYPELVVDYMERLFGGGRGNAVLYQRLRHRVAGAAGAVDQLDLIRKSLIKDRNTRAAVFVLWDVVEDLGAQFPVSPVDGCFRVIDNVLHLLVTARSVDVILGLVPELLVLCQLATDMALDLGLSKARLTYHCWSAHMYEADFLVRVAG
jgi:thymidylate synthase